MNEEQIRTKALIKYHLIGVISGGIVGAVIGSLFETNNALLIGAFAGVITGEIIAIALHSTNNSAN